MAQLRQEMTYREFQLWLAEYQLEPWGEGRADLAAGIIASTVANVNSTKHTFKPADFMIDWSKNGHHEMTDEEMERMAMKCTVLMGGKIEQG